MKDQFVKAARPLGGLFVAVLLMAVVTRVAEGIMGSAGILDYSYQLAKSPIALDGSLFDKMLAVSSGATLFGFMVTAALVTAIAVAFSFVCARAMEDGASKLGGRIGAESLWALLAVLVSFVCFGIVVTGLFSGTQLGLASGMAGGGGMGVAPVMLVLALVSLLVAMAEVVRYCTSGNAFKLVPGAIAAVLCSAAVAVCVAGTFGAFDAQPTNGSGAALWLGIGIVLNIAIITVVNVLPQFGQARSRVAKVSEPEPAAA